MKRKEFKALREKDTAAISKDLDTAYRNLRQHELNSKTKHIKNLRFAQTLKDDIARMKTVLKESELKEKVTK